MMHRHFPTSYVTALQRRQQVIAPIGEQGFLTPIRPTAGDPRSFIFRCRCGAEVVRQAKDVRAGVKAGRVPRCGPACPVVLAEAAARKAGGVSP